MRNDRILVRNQTLLLVVDFQEKLLKAFKEPEKFLPNCVKIIRFAKIMKLPILWTEQYPKGLGVTVEEVKAELAGLNPIEKQSFSCFGETAFVDTLARHAQTQVMVCGIETHICVAQTVLDGIACGYQMHVVADACGSRKKQDHKIGLRKVERAGAVLTTSEMAMYEILARADTQEFREVLQIVR